MREIVDEGAGNNAFVPDDAKIFIRNGAVSKMNICGSAVEPDGPETTPLHFQCPIAFPCRWRGARPANHKLHIGDVRPIPIVDEVAHVGRGESPQRVRINRTGEINPKVVWRIKQSPDQLATLMPDVNVAHHGALAIP